MQWEAKLIHVEIPGFTCLALRHLVLPFDGVIALDAKPQPAVMERLAKLSREIRIHVLADVTDRAACFAVAGASTQLVRLPLAAQGPAKLDLVRRLGVDHTMVIGQSRSDALMLAAAALGVAVHCSNGLAREAAGHADIIVRHTVDALGLLLWQDRLVESLTGPQRETQVRNPKKPSNMN